MITVSIFCHMDYPPGNSHIPCKGNLERWLSFFPFGGICDRSLEGYFMDITKWCQFTFRKCTVSVCFRHCPCITHIYHIYIYTHRIHVWYIFTYLCYKKSTKCITVNIHGSYGILIFLRGDILLVVQKSGNSPVDMVNIPIICKVLAVLAPSKRWLLGMSSINSMTYTTENQP